MTNADHQQPTTAPTPATTTGGARSGDDALRLRLLETAKAASVIPDPFVSITLADIAARINKPESSILYGVKPDGDDDSLTVFRREAYVRVVRRFDTRISKTAHQVVVESLAAGASIPQILAHLCRSIASQFRDDPATPFLLGSHDRTESNPALSEAIQQIWTEFGDNVVDVIQLVVAARHQLLDMDRTNLNELTRVAIAAGWMQTELVVNIDHPSVEIDGASFEQTGLVLWTGIKASLQPGASS